MLICCSNFRRVVSKIHLDKVILKCVIVIMERNCTYTINNDIFTSGWFIALHT